MASEREKGEHVLLREIWRGLTWSVKPCTVVEDSPVLVAIYMQPRTEWLRPRTFDDRPLRVPSQPWLLGRGIWENHVLRLCPRGRDYSLLLIWDERWELRCWYINMEEPLRRSGFGFDYMDLALDIVVSPDMKAATMKDEDELADFVEGGLMTIESAMSLRRSASRALEALRRREAPFDREWEAWRPEPAWSIPVLPERWE